jgi:hypothetical protein
MPLSLIALHYESTAPSLPSQLPSSVQISQINYRRATIELYACMTAPKDSTENLLEGK